MKDEKTAWEAFLQNGSIKTYLEYKRASEKNKGDNLFVDRKKGK